MLGMRESLSTLLNFDFLHFLCRYLLPLGHKLSYNLLIWLHRSFRDLSSLHKQLQDMQWVDKSLLNLQH